MSAKSDKIDFSRMAYETKRHRWLFVVSFVVVMGLCVLYTLKKTPVYAFHANVLIEQSEGNKGGGMMAMMKTFSIGGIGGGSTDDEMLVLNSRSLLGSVVKELGLNCDYREKKGLKEVSLYGKSPVAVTTAVDFDTLSRGYTFILSLKPGGAADVKVKEKRFSTLYEAENVKLPVTVKLPAGAFRIDTTSFYRSSAEAKEIVVRVSGTHAAVDDLLDTYYAESPSLKANGIELNYRDDDIARGKDVLNAVIRQFNLRRSDEERQKAQREISFIDERLASLTSQLSESEKNLEEFKKANDVTDLGAEAKVLLEQTSANKASIVGLQTQLAIFDMICEFLDDPKNRYSMIPVTSGVDYESAAKSIEAYNELVLERTKLDMSAKTDNKALQTLNRQIDGMREGVVETMRKARESAEIAYNDFVREDGKYASRLRQLPSHERQFLVLARDQSVKSSLYVFLLEQRESNALKFSAAPVGRIIDAAYNDVKKVAPKKSIIFGAGLILSLFFPGLFCAFKAVRMKKIRIRQDVESISSLPVVAEMDNPRHAAEPSDGSLLACKKLRNDLLAASAPVKTVALVGGDDDVDTLSFARDLSMAFVRSAKRALIVELDGTEVFSASLKVQGNAASLQSYLTGVAENAADVVANCDSGVDVVRSESGESCTDMLLSDCFVKLMDWLKIRYDVVVVCGGTFDGYSSVPAVASMSDRVIGVVASGMTKSRFLRFDAAMREIAGKAVYAIYK